MLARLVSVIGAAYLHFVGITSFLRRINHPIYSSYLRRGKPYIHALWHNQQVMLAYAHRHENVSPMVSRSKDGELIARTIEMLGLRPVRGSTSRGAESALREMLSLVQEGKRVAFTPDGPRGPVFSVQNGIVWTAMQSGAPIIPTSAGLRQKKLFRSWDRFEFPLPFSVNVIVDGEPFRLSDSMEMDKAKELLKERLMANAEEAANMEKATPSYLYLLAGEVMSAAYSTLSIVLIPIILPFLLAKYGVGRSFRSFGERWGRTDVPTSEKPRLWFHAASVGEWQALKPLIRLFKEEGRWDLFVTVSTPEARALVSKESAITVRLLPVDHPFIISRWVRILNPSAFVLIETELWPTLLHTLYKKNIPVFLVNGRFSKHADRMWTFFRPLLNRMISHIYRFYVRTKEDGQRYFLRGAPSARLEVAGNLKYDNLAIVSPEEKSKRREALFGNNEALIVIGGSTWPGEEEFLINLFSETKFFVKYVGEGNVLGLRLILAPRRLDRLKSIENILNLKPFSWSRWSDVRSHWTSDILLVDTLGELKDLYAVADVAFVGGSLFPKGGQNPLEPAAARMPVLFGPSMENFSQEALALKNAGAARQGRHESDLLMDLKEVIRDPELRASMAAAAVRTVQEHQGVAKTVFDSLVKELAYD